MRTPDDIVIPDETLEEMLERVQIIEMALARLNWKIYDERDRLKQVQQSQLTEKQADRSAV